MSDSGDGPRRGLGGALLTTVLLVVGLAVAPPPRVAGPEGCPASRLSIVGAPEGVVALRPGQEITVEGRGFVEDCDGVTGPRPRRGVDLTIVGGRVSRQVTTLGTADAGTAAEDRLGRISWDVRVPDGQPTGPAVLAAATEGDGFGLALRIVPAS